VNWWGYVRKPSAQERRQKAARAMSRLSLNGRRLSPVVIEGQKIARSFWGRAWCDNLETYKDYEHRLPRGRSYARNRAVLDLVIAPGRIDALVSGSRIYETRISIKPLSGAHWSRVRAQCAGQISSLIELLQGRLSEPVMRVITDRNDGLFPKPREIEMQCSCPDWATMCKHVAAVMYGVGARLDRQPELLFTLRRVDHSELIAEATELEVTRKSSTSRTLSEDVLGDVFGIEIDRVPVASASVARAADKERTAPRANATKATQAAKGTKVAKAKTASRKPRRRGVGR
jgi:uncharacterized Zn finger protein